MFWRTSAGGVPTTDVEEQWPITSLSLRWHRRITVSECRVCLCWLLSAALIFISQSMGSFEVITKPTCRWDALWNAKQCGGTRSTVILARCTYSSHKERFDICIIISARPTNLPCCRVTAIRCLRMKSIQEVVSYSLGCYAGSRSDMLHLICCIEDHVLRKYSECSSTVRLLWTTLFNGSYLIIKKKHIQASITIFSAKLVLVDF